MIWKKSQEEILTCKKHALMLWGRGFGKTTVLVEKALRTVKDGGMVLFDMPTNLHVKDLFDKEVRKSIEFISYGDLFYRDFYRRVREFDLIIFDEVLLDIKNLDRRREIYQRAAALGKQMIVAATPSSKSRELNSFLKHPPRSFLVSQLSVREMCNQSSMVDSTNNLLYKTT
jgi:hypothetical protein